MADDQPAPSLLQRLFLIGSCGVRDTYAVATGGLFRPAAQLTYVTPASAFGEPIDISAHLGDVDNAYVRRSVSDDAAKIAGRMLDTIEFDWLFLDFVMSMNPILQIGGSRLTIASALRQSNLIRQNPLGGRVIGRETPVFWHHWVSGLEEMAARLERRSLRDRVILLRTFPATHFADGSPLRRGGMPDAGLLAFFDRAYAEAGRVFPAMRTIDPPAEMRVGSRTHRWGVHPFHYCDDFYQVVSRQLCEIVGAPMPDRSWSPTNLPFAPQTGSPGRGGAVPGG